jgi:hypothetical protein
LSLCSNRVARSKDSFRTLNFFRLNGFFWKFVTGKSKRECGKCSSNFLVSVLVCKWFLVYNINLVAVYICLRVHIEHSVRKMLKIAQQLKSLPRLCPAVHFLANKCLRLVCVWSTSMQ